ncbi:protein kinase [Penicillium alfredii]|uniref:Protein kinase n=1 Tax=Penicillium alfredii TaxID=1506179 RepID=A0A9W9EMN6_9EURO|nr:protein kinase [Penicillium alfredii]KAJ5084550.1 protein kinase [Penicillium alfredii]
MLGIDDDSVFSDLEEEELQHPVPRKDGDTNGRIIYLSRDLGMPKNLGDPVLCDFAPEVILGIPWTYSVDIWDIYEGGSLFTSQDPEFEKYRSRAYLADIINLLGPPPPSLVARGELRDKLFSSEGDFLTQNLITSQVPLEERETTLEGEEERESFLCFMRKMLQWEPNKRSSAKELAEDE